MCYRHAAISFNRPCPHCGASQCNEQMFCTECGGLMPHVTEPPKEDVQVMAEASDKDE